MWVRTWETVFCGTAYIGNFERLITQLSLGVYLFFFIIGTRSWTLKAEHKIFQPVVCTGYLLLTH